VSDKPKKPRNKSEPRAPNPPPTATQPTPKEAPKPEVKVEPIPKASEKASGSRGRSRSPKGEPKAKAKARPKGQGDKLVDVPRKDYTPLKADNSILASHYNGFGIGYLKEQLQLRGMEFTNAQLKKTYLDANGKVVPAANAIQVMPGLTKADFINKIMELIRTNKWNNKA